MEEDRHRVIIIENEADLALLLKTYFLRKNYEVVIFHSVVDALSCLPSYHPRFIYFSTSASQNPEEDIARIKAAAPGAELMINNFHLPER